MLRAVDLSHTLLNACVRPGDPVVDATAGNGYDMIHLARLNGPDGLVFGFDPQPAAIAAAHQRLASRGIPRHRWHLFSCGHESATSRLPPECRGQLGCLVFNLGYLPGGDHSITTTRASTLQALESLLPWLRPGGMAVLVLYRGHPGGDEEADAVQSFAASLPSARWTSVACHTLTAGTSAPVVLAIERTGG